MPFNSLSGLLHKLEQEHPQWDSYRQYCHMLECWQKVVSPQVSAHTRLLYYRQGVLFVATASATWAQTLSLQRTTLIKNLSPLLEQPLVDLRFSSAQWTTPPNTPSPPQTPNSQSDHTPSSCPRCQVLVKPFELERWGVCSCCISELWSS